MTPAKAVLSAGSQQAGITVGLSPHNIQQSNISVQQATDMGPGIRLETKESSNINKETDNNPIRPGYMCV